MTRVWTRAVTLLAVGIAVAGCATPRGQEPAGSPANEAAVPSDAVAGELTTGHPVTVVERDGRVDLCVGGVLDMAPPGCMGGVELIGWDWDAVAGAYEETGDVRWGEFIVTGIYDSIAESFSPVTVIPGAGYDWPDPDPMGPIIETRCEEPDGGWRILDEATATQEALHATTAVAATLDGYATTWLDRSLVPPVPAGTDTIGEMHHYALTAGHNILNVAVRGDAVAAEEILRRTWGGALCVFSVDYTEAELNALVQELTAAHPFLTAGPDGMTGTVWLSVVYDVDGQLQREVDETYGPGLVRVWSVLQPVAP